MKVYIFPFKCFYSVLFLLAFIFPYFVNGWYKFLISTLMMVGCIRLISEDFIDFIGVKAPKLHLLAALFSCIFLLPIFKKIIIHNVTMGNAIYLESDYNFIWSIGLIFQVLNEEIFLRSIVLKLLKRLTKSSYLIITLPAIFFMLLHFIFYRYSGEYLNLNVLAFLFVCGVILNWLRIYFHHIWFGYALHLAWNIPRFTGEYYSHGFMLTEAASYNLIEGNFNNLKTIIFIVFFSLTYCIFKKYIVLFRQKGRN